MQGRVISYHFIKYEELEKSLVIIYNDRLKYGYLLLIKDLCPQTLTLIESNYRVCIDNMNIHILNLK